MIANVIEGRTGLLVAICDKELLGKTLKYKNIEVFVNPRFYNGFKVDRIRAMELLKKATNINLIGKKSVNLGIELGLIDPKNVLYIGKVPHAQAIVIPEVF